MNLFPNDDSLKQIMEQKDLGVLDQAKKILKFPCLYATTRMKHEAALIIFMDIDNSKNKSTHINFDSIMKSMEGIQKKFGKKIISFKKYGAAKTESAQCNGVHSIGEAVSSEMKENGWQTVGGKRKPKSFADNGRKCPFGFRCKKGLECELLSVHTDQEKEYFQKERDPNKRWLYKRKKCTMDPCMYSNKRYLCSYVHKDSERHCTICNTVGQHWMEKCPKATKDYAATKRR